MPVIYYVLSQDSKCRNPETGERIREYYNWEGDYWQCGFAPNCFTCEGVAARLMEQRSGGFGAKLQLGVKLQQFVLTAR